MLVLMLVLKDSPLGTSRLTSSESPTREVLENADVRKRSKNNSTPDMADTKGAGLISKRERRDTG